MQSLYLLIFTILTNHELLKHAIQQLSLIAIYHISATGAIYAHYTSAQHELYVIKCAQSYMEPLNNME